MIIKDLMLEDYQLALKSVWVTSSGQHTQRQGYIVTLTSDSHDTGQGDCAPLHGTESLEQAQDYLIQLKPHLLKKTIDELLNHDWPVHQYPASCFALETAILDLQAKQCNSSIARILNTEATDVVKVNTMIGHLDEAVIQRATTAEQQGYEVLKIKVGVYTPVMELESLKHLLSKLRPKTRLRLDANQAWTEHEASQFICGLNDFAERIDSLEEPLKSPDNKSLHKLQKATPVELALDESLPDFLIHHSLSQLPVKRIILKPARLGSLRLAYKLAMQANSEDITCIITSGLESNIGLNACIQLSAAVNNNQHHGLATGDWFASNIGTTMEILSAKIRL